MTEDATNSNDSTEEISSPSPILNNQAGSTDDDGDTKTPRKKSQITEGPRDPSLEIVVEYNIEKAIKILKRQCIKCGYFKEVKLRRYYEKPSERKKRKQKESFKKIRKDKAREKKSAFLF